jgi:hypothetical protein
MQETTLTIIRPTFIKRKPLFSKLLQPNEVAPCLIIKGKPKTIQIVDIWADVTQHYRVKFAKPLEVTHPDGSKSQWLEGYVYAPDWQGITAALQAKKAKVTTYSPQGQAYTLHRMPLFQQCNNRDWDDWGSASNLRSGPYQCGLSAAGMVLATIWPNAKVAQHAMEAGGQFEDWVGGIFKKLNLQSTLMEDQVKFFRYLGIGATARRDATLSEARKVLDDLPFVAGRYFKKSGHFIGVAGYGDLPNTTITTPVPVGTMSNLVVSKRVITEPAWIVNDPYGNPELFGSYNNYASIMRTITDTDGLHVLHNNHVLNDIWVDGGERSGWAVFLDPDTKNHGDNPEPAVVLNAKPASEISACSKVKFTHPSWLKAAPVFSGELAASDKVQTAVGDTFTVMVSVAPGASRHYMITAPDDTQIFGRDVWYVFDDHVEVITPGGVSPMTSGGSITQADIVRVAGMIGCDVPAFEAILAVETAGSGMLPSRRPKILFEALYFHDFTDGKYDASHPNISSPRWDRSLYKGGEPEWKRFEQAAKLDKRRFAIGSASWGLGQIMGSHSFETDLGFTGTDDDKAEQFYKMNCSGEAGQLEIMGRFILADPRLCAALKNHKWAKVAEIYNGTGAIAEYSKKLADAFKAAQV